LKYHILQNALLLQSNKTFSLENSNKNTNLLYENMFLTGCHWTCFFLWTSSHHHNWWCHWIDECLRTCDWGRNKVNFSSFMLLHWQHCN